MYIKNHLKIINKLYMFDCFSEEELVEFLDSMDASTISLSKNEVLFREMEPFTSMCVLLDGKIMLSNTDENGNRNIIDILNKSQLFAEVFTLTSNQISPVTATAIEKSTVLTIKTNKLLMPNYSLSKNVQEKKNDLIVGMLSTFAEKNLILISKIEVLSRRNIREKILHFLDIHRLRNNSKIFNIPYSRKEMADFLGVDRSALSRELSKLKDENIIDYDKNTFKII